MIRQVHTHPMDATASSTTDRPNSDPRTKSGTFSSVSAESGDRLPEFTNSESGIGMVNWNGPPTVFVQDGVIVVVTVACWVHWLGVMALAALSVVVGGCVVGIAVAAVRRSAQ